MNDKQLKDLKEVFEKQIFPVIEANKEGFLKVAEKAEKYLNENGLYDDKKPDFNERILKEIADLRNLQKMGVESERITHCLEMLRFVRNSELGLSFQEGLKQEDEWIRNNEKANNPEEGIR